MHHHRKPGRGRGRGSGFGALLCLAAAAPPAWAAGGHHAVDDAALTDPGQCQVETWLDRENGNARSLLHVGPACRFGAVELGLNFDRGQLKGADAITVYGAQAKLAQALDAFWSVGFAFGVAAQHESGRYLGSAALVPVTWQASPTLLAHANVGRDFRHRKADLNRGGLALEWAPVAAGSLVAERYRENGLPFWRLGARWNVTPLTSLDLSRARGWNGAAPTWWTLGWTWAFDR